MNIQQTVHKFITASPRSSMADIITGTGFTNAQVSRAIRTLLDIHLAERCAAPDGKTPVYKSARADRQKKDVKSRIMHFIQEHGGASAVEIALVLGVREDYARHSLRNLLDQHVLKREFNVSTKTWRYVMSNKIYGQSAQMVELYRLLLPVQQARLSA